MKPISLLSTCAALALAASLTLSGCASGSAPNVAPGEASRPDTSNGLSGATAPMPPVTSSSPSAPSFGVDAETATTASIPSDRRVVRSGRMELVVDDVNAAEQSIVGLADVYGGYVVSSSVYQDNGKTFGSVVIRVDASRFESALGAIRALAAEVSSETTSSTDVTEEYVDLTARQHNLEQTEQQLLALMEQAGTVEELLKVQLEVSNVRGQIDQLEARIRYLDQTSAMSLVEVSLRESVLTVSFNADGRVVDEGDPVGFSADVSGGFVPYTYDWDFGDGESSNQASPSHAYRDGGWYSVTLTVTDDRSASTSQSRDSYIQVLSVWSPADVFRDAVSGLGAVGRGFLSFVIWFIVYIPVWLVLGGVAYLLYRRAMRKRRMTADK